MHRSAPVRDAISAGGIVWRAGDTGVEVVLCGRVQDRLWCLPKGTPDEGEGIEATALREVQEETGLLVRVGPKVGAIEYWFSHGGVRFHKRVHHWLMEPVGGDVALHDHEFDVVEWLPIDAAYERLSYENERRMLDRARTMLAEAADGQRA